MAHGNSVTLEGNLTRDPELTFTPGGQAVVRLGLAVNRRVQNRTTQEWEDRTSFFTVVAWQTLAENIAESLVKGAAVVVDGRLEQRQWETEDGEKRSVVEVVADDVGASLKWATVAITKNAKQGRDNQPPADSYDEPGGQPANRRGGGQRRPAQRQEEPPAYDYDEEPF